MAKRMKQGKIVAVYTRISSNGQKDDSQAKALKDYLKAHRLTDVTWYRDKVSGKDLERPAVKKLLADIFAGRVSTVICWRLDRLARDLRDGVNLLADLCEKGVRVVSLCERLDLSGAVGQIVASVLFGVAQMEREAINERIRAGIAAAKERGVKIGRRKGQRSPWNPAKRKVDPAVAKSLRGQGVPVTDIAARFGCTKAAVYSATR